MNCSKCGRKLTEDQTYVYKDKIMCEDCMMDVGLSSKECDPWATYIDTNARMRRGVTGAAELTGTQAKVYAFVKTKGQATRQEIMDSLGLSAKDLDAQLISLMHTELVKEAGSGGRQFLVPIG